MHAKYLPSDLRVNYLHKLSPFPDFHFISSVLLGLGFELQWFYCVFMMNRKAKPDHQTQITSFLKAEITWIVPVA